MKAAAALLAAAALVASPASAAVTGGFSFSRFGGNIRPFEARISPTGRVVVNKEQRRVLRQAQLASLQRLVEQERFLSLPTRIVCKGVLPDVATRKVIAGAHGRTRSVTVQGGCSRRFDRVYAALARAAGIEA